MSILDSKHLEAPVEPFETDGIGYFKAGKYRIILIFEDGSFEEYYIKMKDSYIITIKKRSYVVVPKCVMNGKNPTILYYFNNPNPIFLEFAPSQLNAKVFHDEKDFVKLPKEQQTVLADTFVDADALHVAFSSKIVADLYKENILTVRMMLMILGGLAVLILIVLQATGTVDILGMFTQAGGK